MGGLIDVSDDIEKGPVERLMDAQLHLKMAREGPIGKADERIQRAERELAPLVP